MKKLFKAMLQALKSGEDLVLCSIIASSGSTPRGKGAKMVVFADGSTVGTVGGGAVEHQCTLLAKCVLEEKKAIIQGYNLSPNETADIGMVCGGKVTVHFEHYHSGDAYALSVVAYIVTLFDKDEDTWLITDLAEDAGSRLSVYTASQGPKFIEGDRLDYIMPMLRSKGMYRREAPAYFVEPLTQAGTVYVFGGGHVSQELVPVIAHLGFRTVVFDEREQFACKALFPQAADTLVGPYERWQDFIQLKPSDYVVIMTRGHQADYIVLEQVVRAYPYYVGVIGSKSKKEHTFKRLLEAGVSQSELDHIHTPIGLPINGETPAEIAISIAGELILKRAEKREVSS